VVAPGSHCPACGTPITPLQNVPVFSWLALRGRCAACGSPISARYPLVEAATCLLFVALAWAVGPAAPLLALLAMAACGVATAGIAADGFAVPRVLIVIGAASGVWLGVLGLVAHSPGRLGWAAVGAVAVTVVSVALGRTAGAGGHGDVGAAAVLATLAWDAGWLWAPAGVGVALCVAAVGLSARVGERAPERILPAGDTAAPGGPATGGRRTALSVVVGLGLLVVAAAVGA